LQEAVPNTSEFERLKSIWEQENDAKNPRPRDYGDAVYWEQFHKFLKLPEWNLGVKAYM
jgi:hypothetical protein